LSFFFSSRRRHTRFSRDWSSDVCSSDLFFVIREHGFIPSLDKPFQCDRGSKNWTLCNRPSTHSRSAPRIGLTVVNTQTDQILPFPFRLLPVFPDAIP